VDEEKRIDRVLDVKGMPCPGPTVMAMKAMKDMKKGCILKVITDDGSTRETIPLLCSWGRYRIIESRETDGLLYFVIQK
jgi:TusA-related sulfurtransferase